MWTNMLDKVIKFDDFFGVPCMAYILLVKDQYTRRYQRSVREAQSINREIWG